MATDSHLHRRRSPSPREGRQRKRCRPADDGRRHEQEPSCPAAEGSPGEPPPPPVMLRGFDDRISARGLADRLEAAAGTVWRCRVKTSVTPPGSYPDFHLQLPPLVTAAAATSPHDGAVPAHAFVHFARPGAVARAARSGLQLCGGGRARPSDVISSSLRAARRRRRCDAKPMLFPDSRVEAGDLVAPGTFLAAWRAADDGDPASASPLDFVVDPSGGRCRLLFARDAAFVSPGAAALLMLCCDVKLEFPVGDVVRGPWRSWTTTRCCSESRPRPCCTTVRRGTTSTARYPST